MAKPPQWGWLATLVGAVGVASATLDRQYGVAEAADMGWPKHPKCQINLLLFLKYIIFY